jgi:hypothetical protein
MADVEELKRQLAEAQENLEKEKETVTTTRQRLKDLEARQMEEASLRDKVRELDLRLDESRKVTTLVEVNHDRHLAKFSGEGSVTEWVDDATLALEDWGGSDKGKVRFLVSHLTEMAREEVRLHSEEERDTAEKVFAILRKAFKGQSTSAKKLGDFYTRSQRQGESLREYSLALMALRSAANKAGEEAISEKLLCQQFLEGMTDEGLSRELSRLLDQNQEMTWDQLRHQSLKWSRRSDHPRRAGAVREVEAVEVRATGDDMQEPEWRAEMRELRKQLEQLTRMVASAGGTKTTGMPPAQKRAEYCYRCGSREHKQPACPKKARVCFGCGQEGHINKDCPKKTRTNGAGNGLPPQ